MAQSGSEAKVCQLLELAEQAVGYRQLAFLHLLVLSCSEFAGRSAQVCCNGSVLA